MSDESAKLRREIRELQDRSHNLIQKTKKLVEATPEEVRAETDGASEHPRLEE
jgi:hypothetical protein